MRVLVACEFSGTVRRAFRALGHDAWSCDILPAEDGSQHHIVGNVRCYLRDGWDLMVAHPPCTYLATSGLHWNKHVPGRDLKTEAALYFVGMLMRANIPRIAIENPVSCISSKIRKPDQIIQPWYFGHDASKKTCLWLKNLPPLVETNRLPGDHKTRRANQTISGHDKRGSSFPNRAQERSRTFTGIAAAMADQWGSLGRYRP